MIRILKHQGPNSKQAPILDDRKTQVLAGENSVIGLSDLFGPLVLVIWCFDKTGNLFVVRSLRRRRFPIIGPCFELW